MIADTAHRRFSEGGTHHYRSRDILWTFVLLIAFFLQALPLTGLETQGLTASRPIRVAVFVDQGACGDKTVALFRALAAAGCQPLGIETDDIEAGRLNKTNFDVFVLPAGEDGATTGYWDYNYLGNYKAWMGIRRFANSGGGLLGIEAGASFLSNISIGAPRFVPTYPQPGLEDFTIVDGAFGIGSQSAYVSSGGGYFKTSKTAVTVASDTLGRPALVRCTLSKGRIVLCGFDPELRGDSELDWTIWDNWDLGGVHPNSEGCWILLGRMVRWAASGDASAPNITAAIPSGARVAFVSTHTADGGAAPSLQPAFARAIESAGHLPLAIRLQDICDGRLTTQDFKVLALPG
ncbi:MAG: hypothetical protein WC637_10875, partial [Victivallales bacterium]